MFQNNQPLITDPCQTQCPSVPAAVFCECQTRSLRVGKVSLSRQMNFNYVGFFWSLQPAVQRSWTGPEKLRHLPEDRVHCLQVS